jgi:hypothetical protein
MSRNIEKLAEELSLDLKLSKEAIAAKTKK